MCMLLIVCMFPYLELLWFCNVVVFVLDIWFYFSFSTVFATVPFCVDQKGFRVKKQKFRDSQSFQKFWTTPWTVWFVSGLREEKKHDMVSWSKNINPSLNGCLPGILFLKKHGGHRKIGKKKKTQDWCGWPWFQVQRSVLGAFNWRPTYFEQPFSIWGLQNEYILCYVWTVTRWWFVFCRSSRVGRSSYMSNLTRSSMMPPSPGSDDGSLDGDTTADVNDAADTSK